MYTKEEAEEVKRLCRIPVDKLSCEEKRKLKTFTDKYPEAFERILDQSKPYPEE